MNAFLVGNLLQHEVGKVRPAKSATHPVSDITNADAPGMRIVGEPWGSHDGPVEP